MATPWLVKGVLVERAGSAIETVSIGGLTMHLLATWDGAEVVRQEIPAGMRFGLTPAEGWSGLECFYVLKGEAVWEQGEDRVLLGPGDCIKGIPVQEACILRALSDMETLYFVSRPMFHSISQELERLRQLTLSVEEKDGYTAEHCRRLQEYSAKVGRVMRLSPSQQEVLLYGSFLHDLGKVGVPTSILNKPGALTPEEWVIMKQHPTIGADMVMCSPAASAAPILEQHHERLDGSGYPRGLKGDEILLEAQIVAVVDTWDAMTSDRVYRKALPFEEARAELIRCSGRLFRPDVVEALL
ncbi:MAG TPA: HD domain-containing phosphohydrolase, partial [Symbiobacteriaceae bacterium]|nr:HD domain-containing phosphohydrolase [Symbiobacteriaceae bacterium]